MTELKPQDALDKPERKLDEGKVFQVLQETHPHIVNKILAQAICEAFDRGEI